MIRVFRLSVLAIVFFVVGCCSRCEVLPRKEEVLKEDLYSMRQAIDQFTQDKNKAPQDLEDLVRAGYLRAIPKDPITNSSATWQLVQEDVAETPDQTQSGITDVHSGSNQVSSEGTRYSSW